MVQTGDFSHEYCYEIASGIAHFLSQYEMRLFGIPVDESAKAGHLLPLKIGRI
jgi:hypothetical protein